MTKLTTQKVYTTIIDTIEKNRKSPIELDLKYIQSYTVLSFYDVNSLRIKCGKKESYIAIAGSFTDLLPEYPLELTTKQTKSDGAWVRIFICSLDDLNILTPLLLEIYDKAYWLAPYESIACCSRYKECSDSTKCVQLDAKLARGCEYNKNLTKGKIFYGKNRTIV